MCVKNYFLFILFLLCHNITTAQLNYQKPDSALTQSADSTTSFWDNLSVGGSFNMSHQNPTTISLAPSVEYKLSKLFQAGLNANFTFSKSESQSSGTQSNMAQSGVTQSSLDYGFGLYSKFSPKEKLPFFQVEYQGNYKSMDSLQENSSTTTAKSFKTRLLLGGGLEISIHKNTRFRATIMRDLSWSSTATDQSSPWEFRVGVMGNLSFSNKDKNKDWIASLKEMPFKEGFIPIPTILKKLDVEGNVSMQLGKPSTIDFSPMLNVTIDTNFSAGIGPSVQLKSATKLKKIEDIDLEKKINYGARAYLRYQYHRYLPFLQIEYEGIHGLGDSLSWGEDNRKWISSILVGAGYKVKIKKVGEFGVTALRNLSYQERNPVHNSPWVIRTSFKKDLPFDDVPIPGTVPPKKRGFRLADLLKLEGNLGLSLGEMTKIDFAPSLAHEFTDHFSLGAGPIIKYQNDKKIDISSTFYGGRMFGRFTPAKHYPFFQAEVESINTRDAQAVQGAVSEQNRDWNSALLLGGGVQFPIGKSHSFNISALRDVTWKGQTPVRNDPWVIRIGLQI